MSEQPKDFRPIPKPNYNPNKKNEPLVVNIKLPLPENKEPDLILKPKLEENPHSPRPSLGERSELRRGIEDTRRAFERDDARLQQILADVRKSNEPRLDEERKRRKIIENLTKYNPKKLKEDPRLK